MINTDLPIFEGDLKEVINLFEGAEQMNIRHLFSESEKKLVNTIVLDGKKSYAYGNLIPDSLTQIEKKRYLKRYAKLSLYKALSQFYGKNLPWGALTGIRPTKLAYREKEEGKPFEPLFEKMHVSPENTALIRRVLTAQEGIYEKGKGAWTCSCRCLFALASAPIAPLSRRRLTRREAFCPLTLRA